MVNYKRYYKGFPILASLIESGAVFIENGQYVGRSTVPSIMAPEGLVGLGMLGDEPATERYLSANPRPDQW